MFDMPAKPVNLYVVVPCYNEEAVLRETSKQLLALFEKMREQSLIDRLSRIVFVDDGSKDATWKLIDELSAENDEIYGIKLARNVGHQNALFAGLMTVKDSCECTVSIDADLQDDINAIPEMVKKFTQGCDIVYGVRSEREKDSFFKRTTAIGFYKLMKIMGADVVYNHADYRLMSARALNALSQFGEVNMFLRGMVPLVGYKSDCVYYARGERFAGESKYPLKKMLSFAFDGITSFSITPIRLVSVIGGMSCVFSIVMAIYAIIQKFAGNTDAGWASIIISLWFLGGMILLSLGLIGEYIGKIYKEVKNRPRYIIEEVRF